MYGVLFGWIKGTLDASKLLAAWRQELTRNAARANPLGGTGGLTLRGTTEAAFEAERAAASQATNETFRRAMREVYAFVFADQLFADFWGTWLVAAGLTFNRAYTKLNSIANQPMPTPSAPQ